MKVKKTPKFYLKDILFNKEKVEKLAEEIYVVYKKFDKDNFTLTKNGTYYDFKYSIRVPENATGGTHQAGIIFTETPVDKSPGANNIGIDARLSALIFVIAPVERPTLC